MLTVVTCGPPARKHDLRQANPETMRLYLDDDITAAILVLTLRRAVHDVRTPAEARLSGASDAVHFRQAIQEERILLSRNYRDFRDLHALVLAAKGHHPGILLVRRDNAANRNMKPGDVVRALRNLELAQFDMTDNCLALNQWQ
jgi:hypothetical protein